MPDEQTPQPGEPEVTPEATPEIPEQTATGGDDLRGAGMPSTEKATNEAMALLQQIRSRQPDEPEETPEETPAEPQQASEPETPDTPEETPEETPAEPQQASEPETPDTPEETPETPTPEAGGHDAVVDKYRQQIGSYDPVEYHEALHQHAQSLETNPAETIRVLIRQYESRNPEMRELASRLQGQAAPTQPQQPQQTPPPPAAPAPVTLDLPDDDLDTPGEKAMKAQLRQFAKAVGTQNAELRQQLSAAQEMAFRTDVNSRTAVIEQRAATTIDAFRATLAPDALAAFDDQAVATRIGVLTKDDPRFSGANFTTEHLAEVFNAATLSLPHTQAAAIQRIAKKAAPAPPPPAPRQQQKRAPKPPIQGVPSQSSRPTSSETAPVPGKPDYTLPENLTGKNADPAAQVLWLRRQQRARLH